MSALNFIQSLHWREPLLLWVALFPLLLLALRMFCQSNRLESYAEKRLHRWVVIKQLKTPGMIIFSRMTAFVLAWLLLVIAAAGPRVAIDVAGEEKSIKQDIYLVIDLSRSMRATDIEPDRLRRSRIELYELLSRANADANRFGVIVYTAGAHVLVPLTHDTKLVEYYLSLIDKIAMPTYGSDPVNALGMAFNALDNSTHPSSIIWVTDGDIEEQHTKPMDTLADKLLKSDIPLFILNAGTVEGDAIQLDSGEWLTDAGQAVVSRTNVALLKEIANKTGGGFSNITDDDSDWVELYDQGVKVHVEKAFSPGEEDSLLWREYFPYTLLPGLLFLFIALMPYSLPRMDSPLALKASGLLLLLTIYPYNDALAENNVRQAHTSFNEQRFSESLQAYETVVGYHGRFGQGASAYRLGDYAQAINQFTQAVLQASDEQQRASALYNLANAYFKIGNYPAAIQVYGDVLHYATDMKMAKSNRALSIELQEAVELRLQQRQEKASRMGRGQRSQTASENIEITDFGVVSLDDSENQQYGENTIDSLYETLLEKGVEYADLAATDAATNDNYSREQSFSDAQLGMQTLNNQQEYLWKRLFEIDTGFAAPQDKPSSVSGVKPW